MISKELLSEVLKTIDKVTERQIVSHARLWYKGISIEGNPAEGEQNIHELAFKCKEWARDKGFKISSGYSSETRGYCYATPMKEKWESGKLMCIYMPQDCPVEDFLSFKEYEAIFKACQWILEKENA